MWSDPMLASRGHGDQKVKTNQALQNFRNKIQESNKFTNKPLDMSKEMSDSTSDYYNYVAMVDPGQKFNVTGQQGVHPRNVERNLHGAVPALSSKVNIVHDSRFPTTSTTVDRKHLAIDPEYNNQKLVDIPSRMRMFGADGMGAGVVQQRAQSMNKPRGFREQRCPMEILRAKNRDRMYEPRLVEKVRGSWRDLRNLWQRSAPGSMYYNPMAGRKRWGQGKFYSRDATFTDDNYKHGFYIEGKGNVAYEVPRNKRRMPSERMRPFSRYQNKTYNRPGVITNRKFYSEDNDFENNMHFERGPFKVNMLSHIGQDLTRKRKILNEYIPGYKKRAPMTPKMYGIADYGDIKVRPTGYNKQYSAQLSVPRGTVAFNPITNQQGKVRKSVNDPKYQYHNRRAVSAPTPNNTYYKRGANISAENRIDYSLTSREMHPIVPRVFARMQSVY